VPDELVDAVQNRGVDLDIGYGSRHFSWKVLEKCIDAGIPPVTISTDISRRTWRGNAPGDFPHMFSGFTGSGLFSLEDVLKRVTVLPAQRMHFDYENNDSLLVLRKVNRPMEYSDNSGNVVKSDYEYRPALFLKDGKVVLNKIIQY